MAPFRELLANSPVNEQKWRVLRVLAESGPLEQKVIADEACLLLSSLTRMLQAMEADGLVSRQTDPADRRRIRVSITAKGQSVIDTFAGESAAILDRIEAQLGPEKLETLLDLLEDLRRIRL